MFLGQVNTSGPTGVAFIIFLQKFTVKQGNLVKGRLTAVDLLAPTSLDQRLFISKILITIDTKRATLMRRSTVL